MKKLFTLLFLFLAVQGMGQDQSFDYPPKIVGIVSVFNGSPLKPGTIVLDGNNPGAIRNATFAEELLFLLQEYNEYCFNDSTQATYDLYVWNNDTVKSYPSIDPDIHPGILALK